MNPKVIIVGGGLGGLCLGQGLKKAGVPFRIFERDTSANWRGQGYRIGLQIDGIQALESTLSPSLWQTFEKTCVIPNKSVISLTATDAESLPTPDFKRGGRFYIADRSTLRTLLTIGLEENIEYGKTLEKFESEDYGVTTHFKDGTKYSGSLLVAADGANSVVRKQHMPENPLYDTERRCVYGKTPLTEDFLSKFNTEVARNSTFVLHNESNVFCLMDPVRFQNDPHSIDSKLRHVTDYVYWALLAEKSLFGIPDEKLLRMTPDQVAQISQDMTQNWHSSLRPLFEYQDKKETAIMKMTTSHPEQKQWRHDPKIAFLGDAAHAMLPTGASGANTALRDAFKLSEILGKSGGIPSGNDMENYDKEVKEYGGEKVAMSLMNATKVFKLFPSFENFKPVVQ